MNLHNYDIDGLFDAATVSQAEAAAYYAEAYRRMAPDYFWLKVRQRKLHKPLVRGLLRSVGIVEEAEAKPLKSRVQRAYDVLKQLSAIEQAELEAMFKREVDAKHI